jgi:hypothetical protein
VSTTLYWRPVNPVGGDLPYDLKRILAKKFWNSDGASVEEEVQVGLGDLSYLEGLADAGIPGASVLIDLIKKHIKIVLFIA